MCNEQCAMCNVQCAMSNMPCVIGPAMHRRASGRGFEMSKLQRSPTLAPASFLMRILCFALVLGSAQKSPFGEGLLLADAPDAAQGGTQKLNPISTSWPMFRGGPALLGVASGPLAKELSLLWTFKSQGPVKSSAAIDQDRVYIGSADARVYALE